MFYDIFRNLCYENHETPNSVCRKLGFSQAAAPYWKKSQRPPKREGLEIIANYFGVSVDYLLGKETKKEPVPVETNRSELFAILARLTDAEIDDLLQYSEFLLAKRINPSDPKFR